MKKIVSALLCCAMLFTTVFAAVDGTKVTTDLATEFQALSCEVVANEIKIEGIGGSAEKTVVTFYVTDGESVVYLKQIYTQKDGTFAANIVLDPSRYNADNTGVLYISSKNANTRMISDIELYSQEELDSFVADYQNIASADDMGEFINTYSDLLGLDITFTNDEIAVLYESYVANKPVGITSVSDTIAHAEGLLEDVVTYKAFIAEINEAAKNGDWAEIRNLMQVKYVDIVPFETEIPLIRDERAFWLLMTGEDKNYTDFQSVKAVFDEAAEARKEAEAFDGRVTDDKSKDFADEWKISVNANLITVSGRTDDLGEHDIVIYISDYNVTEPHILAMYVVTTEESGEFTASFAVDPEVYGDETMGLVKVGGTDRNVWQFCIELFGADLLDEMVSEFKTIESSSDMHDFLKSYGSALGIGEGYDADKAALLYEIYTNDTYDEIAYPEEVAAEIVRIDQGMTVLKSFIDDMNKYSKKRNAGHMLKAVETDYAELANVSAVFAELYEASTSNKKVSKQGIYLRMVNMTFGCVQDILDAYNAAYKEQKEFEEDRKESTGGSGGGGGGFSGGSTVVDISPELIPETPKEDINPEKLPVAPFNDLEGYDWAKDSIDELRKIGIVRGDGNGSFRPGDKMTREELLSMLLATFEIEAKIGAVDFTDVKQGQWYFDIVATAYGMGITNGMGDGTFGIGQNVIRADMATLAARLVREMGINIDKTVPAFIFNDFTDIPEYAYNDVITLQQSGILKGDDKGNFNPNSDVTRAEAAVFFRNIHDAVKGSI